MDNKFQKNKVSIGIDLGTTNTCVGVFKNGKVEIVQTDSGKRTIPSVVCFADQIPLVGEVAKDKMHKYPQRTAYDVKRIIGRSYSELCKFDDLKTYSFKIVGKDDQPYLVITKGEEDSLFYPQEISALVLKEAKKIAEDRLGCKVDSAVITVPAYFNQAQRQATVEAAKIAEIDVLKIINEPSAAAIAYGFENKSEVSRTVLVYDLGGGTFDVSIVKILGATYKVKATAGDTRIGGKDFEDRLINFLVSTIKNKYNEDIQENIIGMSRLKKLCNLKKEKLSFENNVELELLGLLKNQEDDVELNITRQMFEELNKDLFERTIDIVALCLNDAKISKDDIDEVVLVGGSSRIPMIQHLLQDFFGGRPLKKSINPDEAVAYGATLQANVLSNLRDNKTLDVQDVTSLSLGLLLIGNKYDVCIPKNSTIPCKVSRQYATSQDYQTEVLISIYQGESLKADDNHHLGEFEIRNIRKKKMGRVIFDITFEIDENGILHVHAKDKHSRFRGDVHIGLEENTLSMDTIASIISKANNALYK